MTGESEPFDEFICESGLGLLQISGFAGNYHTRTIYPGYRAEELLQMQVVEDSMVCFCDR